MIVKSITKNRTRELLKEYRNLQSVRSKALTREINIVYDVENKKYVIVMSMDGKVRLMNGKVVTNRNLTYDCNNRKYYGKEGEKNGLILIATDEEIYGTLYTAGTVANAEKILFNEINFTVQDMIKR